MWGRGTEIGIRTTWAGSNYFMSIEQFMMTKANHLLTVACSFVASTAIYNLFFVDEFPQHEHEFQVPTGGMQFCNTGLTAFDGGRECSVFTLAAINLMVVPYINRILETPYFRYFKVDLDKNCPFWDEPKVCYGEDCAVKLLSEAQVPSELFAEANISDVTFPQFISERKIFGQWDSMQSAEFCTFDSEQSPGVYVDLLANPEGYTGYVGESARHIWESIYSSGCGETTESGILEWRECNEKADVLSAHFRSSRLRFDAYCEQVLQQVYRPLGGEH